MLNNSWRICDKIIDIKGQQRSLSGPGEEAELLAGAGKALRAPKHAQVSPQWTNVGPCET